MPPITNAEKRPPFSVGTSMEHAVHDDRARNEGDGHAHQDRLRQRAPRAQLHSRAPPRKRKRVSPDALIGHPVLERAENDRAREMKRDRHRSKRRRSRGLLDSVDQEIRHQEDVGREPSDVEL